MSTSSASSNAAAGRAGRSSTSDPTRATGRWRGRAESAEAATVEAMRRGDDVIYQATLFDGRWLGYADFLLRVERPSALRSVELRGGRHEAVPGRQGRRGPPGLRLLRPPGEDSRAPSPEAVHVVTGDGATHAMRLDDYAAYYRAVKRRFEREIFGDARRTSARPSYSGHLPGPRRALPGLHLVPRLRRLAARPTTTSRSWPAWRGRRPSASMRGRHPDASLARRPATSASRA